jgi:hypothetical protein
MRAVIASDGAERAKELLLPMHHLYDVSWIAGVISIGLLLHIEGIELSGEPILQEIAEELERS